MPDVGLTPPQPGFGDMQGVYDEFAKKIQPEIERSHVETEQYVAKKKETVEKAKKWYDEIDTSSEGRAKIQEEAAAEIEKLKPQKAPEFHETSPIQAFGSFATILGTLAGLLTRQPLTTALNAGAEAMKAIHTRDLETYDYKIKEWKASAEHAEKMLNWSNAKYAKLLDKFDQKPKEIAQKIAIQAFADGQEDLGRAAMEGDHKKMFDLLGTQFNIALQMKQARETAWDHAMAQKDRMFNQDVKTKEMGLREGTADRDKARLELEMSKPENLASQALIREKGGIEHVTAEDATKLANALHAARGGGMTNWRSQLVQKGIDEYKAGHNGEEPPAHVMSRIIADATKGGLTGNQSDKIAEHIDQIDNALGAVDRIEALFEKHIGAAGLGGKLTRPAEAISNVFGSNETDRAQLKREIEYLQAISPRLFTQTQGRQLSSEAKHTQAVIAGLNMGDTTANVLRAYNDLRPLFQTLRAEAVRRFEGTFDPNAGLPPPSAPGKPAPAGNVSVGKPWDDAPVVGE